MGNIINKCFQWQKIDDIARYLNEHRIHKVAAEYQESLNEMHNLPLNIAVTGQTRSGKLSFVNAFRGVRDNDHEAAKVGLVEEAMEPKAYPHPSFSNIKIWDLPGIGTPKFQATEYLKKVQFEKYDVFIIVTSYEFTKNDALLAKELRRMRKKFYFVCTEIDASIQDEMRKGNFNTEKTLANIRKSYENSFRSAGDFSSRIFLISSWEVHMYDFPLLQETMAAELPDHKKNILTLSMHIFSENELMKKKELMKSYIKKVAWVSCAGGVVPVPRLSMVCDIGILVDALKYFCKVFGLDNQSLRFLETQMGKKRKQLKSAITKTPLDINEKLVFSLLMRSSLCVAVSIVKLGLDFIPVPWSGGASSYAVTHHFLNSFLDDAVEDAQNVRAKLLEEINISEKAETQYLSPWFVGCVFFPCVLSLFFFLFYL